MASMATENIVNNNKLALVEMENSKLNVEIEYLKKLVEEMGDKNNLLKQNNGLLYEKIFTLEMQINNNNKGQMQGHQKYFNPTNATTAKNITEHTEASSNKQNYAEALKTTQVPLPAPILRVSGVVDRQSRKQNRQPSTSRTAVCDRGQEFLSDTDSQEAWKSTNLPNESKDDGFTLPKRRYKKRLGNAKPSSDSTFAGGERKVWLYLYRIKRNCTESEITDYVKEKPGFENLSVQVRGLPSDLNKLKCFVLTAPLDKKDEMYEPSFWPRFVGVKRFNFSKHKTFLESAGDFLAAT